AYPALITVDSLRRCSDGFRQRLADAGEHQAGLEQTALARRTFHGNIAAHDLSEQPRDGQSQSGSDDGAAGFADPLKGAEDALHIFRSNAFTRILHTELGNLIAIAQCKTDLALLGILDGV